MASQPIPPAPVDDFSTLAREIRFRLQPKSEYYNFIHRVLFCGNPDLANLDPFEVDIMQRSPESIYHNREDVSRTIDRPGSMIIMGRSGSGKTMLFNTRKAVEGQLLVRISMAHIDHLATFQPEVGGAQSPLNAWTLAYLIFNAFWIDLFNNPIKQAILPHFRTKKSWLENLRWFYHHFPIMPLQPAKYLDFAMEAWLQTEPDKDRTPAGPIRDHILEKLVQFIEMQDDVDPSKFLYERITVWVDGVDTLKGNDLNNFVKDIYHILELRLSCFEIKVLINKSNQDSFPQETKFAYYPNNLSFYELPAWETDDLRKMLFARLRGIEPTLLGGNDIDNCGRIDNELPKFNEKIFDSYVQEHFFDDLIKESKREPNTGDQDSQWDAPIHLLRLIRGCLAYANGQWPNAKTRTVLKKDIFAKIINAYWDI